MKKITFYVGLFLALLVSTNTVFAQNTPTTSLPSEAMVVGSKIVSAEQLNADGDVITPLQSAGRMPGTPLATGTPGLVLAPTSSPTAMGLAYNPMENRYYSSAGGTTSRPIDCHDGTTGALINSTVPGVDQRGIWWNPNTMQPEGNAFGSAGVYSITTTGECPDGGNTLLFGGNQPDSQSKGDFDYDNNEIIYFVDASTSILRVDRTNNATIATLALTATPAGSDYAESSIGYTGVTGYEYALFDVVTNAVHLYDTAGMYQASVTINETINPGNERFYFSYENDLAWVFTAANTWTSHTIFSSMANTPPEIFCPADIMTGTDPGVCGAVVNFAGVAIDAEDDNATLTASITSSPFNTGDEFPVGTTTVTLSVTDSGGLTATCTFDVIVTDTEDPMLACPANITQTNDPGICGAVVTYDPPVVTDNCPEITGTPTPQEVLFPTENTPFNSNTRGYTFVAPSDFVITGLQVPDDTSTDPQSIQVMRFAAAIPNFPTTASYDELLFYTNGDTSTGYIPVNIPIAAGDIIGILGVRGNNRNSYSNQTNITIDGTTVNIERFGTQNSIISTQAPQGSFWTEPAANNQFKSRVNFEYVTSIGGLVQTAGLPSGSEFPVGTTTNTFVYTDSGGNTATCSFDVTVTDDEAPVITCAGDPAPIFGSATAVDGNPIPDNDPAGLTSTLDVTDDFDITDLNVNLDINHTWMGDLAVTLTAPDGTTTVQLVDRPGVPATGFGCNNVDPAINIDLDDEATNTVEDSCPEPYVGMFIPNEALSAFDGISTVGTWTLNISDNAGGDTGTLNGWTLNYEYVAVSPALDVVLDVNGMATVNVADLLLGFSDNCGVDSVTVLQDVGVPTPGSLATTFVTNNGGANGGAVYFDVTAAAGSDVTISDIDLHTGETGAFTVDVFVIDGGTYVGNEGNAGAWTLATMGSGTANGLGTPSNAVLDTPLVVTGGTTVAMALVLDATHSHEYNGTGANPPSPLSYSDANITIDLGSASNVAFDGAPFSPRVANVQLNYSALANVPTPVGMFDVDCEDVGENTIEVTVTDVNGNTSTCTATYNVIDNIDPVLVCQDFTLELGPDGTAVLDPFDMIDLTATLEACGIDTVGADIVNFTCDDIGAPIEITIFGADPSLNASACTAFLTVVDASGPEVTCPADQTVDPGANNQLYEVPDYWANGDATATDNCTDEVTIFTQDPAPGSLIPDGTYTVTLCATDDEGNEECCTFELTVESILGVNDTTLDAGITMFPNPAQGVVTIANSSNIVLERAAIYDVNGKLVNTIDLSNMQGEQTIDIAALASGVYVVQIESADASIVKRLIKE